jgi:phosphinothricin acetyltransferase
MAILDSDIATTPIVRPARETDVERLTEIYNHYILNSPATFDIEPFTVAQRREWFSHYRLTGRHRVFVAERAGVVAGAAWSSQFRPKEAYDTTVEVSVYCASEATGLGLGTRLYAALFAALESEPIHRAIAGITQPNDASVKLHERFGFRQVALMTEVGQKFGKFWDVAWFEREM